MRSKSICVLQCGQMAVMFSNIKYRAVDYSYEASTRCRLMMNLLMLPVPIQLNRNIYPHSAHPQSTYRTPWTRANLRNMARLQSTGSVLDDLKVNLCSLDVLERFGVCVSDVAEVVLSSNPSSQNSVESEKDLLWLKGQSENPDWRETFSLADVNSACFSLQDLFLPDETIVHDPLKKFMSQLPQFLMLVQRLKYLPVSFPLLHHSGIFIYDRHCEPYDIVLDQISRDFDLESAVEEFRKESVLTEEALMLPVVIKTNGNEKRDLMSIRALNEYLKLPTEQIEDQKSSLDTIRKVSPTDDLGLLQHEIFHASLSDSDINNMTPSPVPYKPYVEMETELILSPPHRPILPKLFLSTIQLSPEVLPTVCGKVLLSEYSHEVIEKDVWRAKKHHHSVAALLLAEPHISCPPVRSQHVPELFSLLKAERQTHIIDKQGLDTFSILIQNLSHWNCIEPMILEKLPVPDTAEDAAEKFTQLSALQIDKLLRTFEETIVSEVSIQSTTTVTSLPICMQEGKDVKFSLLEKTFQKQNTFSKNRKTEKDSKAVNKYLSKDIQSGMPSFTRSGTPECLSDSKPEQRGDNFLIKPITLLATQIFSDTHEGTLFQISNSLGPPEGAEGCQVMPSQQKPGDSFVFTASVRKDNVPRLAGLRNSQQINSLSESQEDMDPLSSFMRLRTQQRSPVLQKMQQDSTQKSMGKHTEGLNIQSSEKFKSNEANLHITERAFSKTIYIQATETERFAYYELHALALPSLSRVCELDANALSCKDFKFLTSEDVSYSLKQQEKLLILGRESLYNEMALLQILVTVKELLLKCNLNTAIEMLSSCTLGVLKELLRKLQVLLYLSQMKEEGQRHRLVYLQEQTNSFLQKNTSNTVLVVTAMEHVRTVLVTALNQVPGILGSSVTAILPKEGKSKVESSSVICSLSCSRCLIVCSQHIGVDFPWRRFSVVMEFDALCHSTISIVCSQNNVNYICFCTDSPDTDAAVCPLAYLDHVPFVLFVTEGLLKRSELLQLLESTYNMTLLERSYGQTLQRLGATHHYDIITVDENTAILLQELGELQQEQASQGVVIRLLALSLQFSHCWIILHCTEHHSKLVYGDVFSNLLLIYSSFVLFGLKTEDLDIKVFLVCDEEDIAWCVSQICLYTLLRSERSVCGWLDRQGFSVLPTEEEEYLVCFPCVNHVIANLMLRTTSLQWLLGASFSELKGIFSEIPLKIWKLFSDITTHHRLSASIPQSESEATGHLESNIHYPPPHLQVPHWTMEEESQSYIELSFTQSAAVLYNPGPVQQQLGTLGSFGAVHGASVSGSECMSSVRSQLQDKSYTGCIDGEEEQWTVDVSSQSDVNLRFRKTHTPCAESSAPKELYNQFSPEENINPSSLQQRMSVYGVNSRGQQKLTHNITPYGYRDSERKRLAREDEHTVLPECKRGRLLYERIPGRCDGQTRLRFF
ncbi:protein shortage in chiasmata 1 ortholog-like isoform X2 [Hoplias malabaricus]|uniref:protein shortage in chiasmata 1 ortholog-like isoform X2 n=1 Tax=Hoplias malabaricus TaxID=27720 RepID=UPI0034628998